MPTITFSLCVALAACQPAGPSPIAPQLAAAAASTQTLDALMRSEIRPVVELCLQVGTGAAIPADAAFAAQGFDAGRSVLGNRIYRKSVSAMLDGNPVSGIEIALNPEVRRCNVTLIRPRSGGFGLARAVIADLQSRGYTLSRTDNPTEFVFTRGATRFVMTGGDGANGPFFGFNPA